MKVKDSVFFLFSWNLVGIPHSALDRSFFDMAETCGSWTRDFEGPHGKSLVGGVEESSGLFPFSGILEGLGMGVLDSRVPSH